jgi:hypothetical protein
MKKVTAALTTKNALLLLFAVGVIGGGLFGAHNVSAQTTTPKQNGLSGLVEMIAQKFNLDKSQVQGVVDQYQQQHKTEMEQVMQDRLNTKLDTMVKNGKITAAQKQAILNKLAELKKNYNPETFKNMTPEQRKAAKEKEISDLKAWAQSQGIDLKLLPMFGMKGMGRGMGMHRMGTTPEQE